MKSLRLVTSLALITIVPLGAGACSASTPVSDQSTTLRLALNTAEDHPSYLTLDNFSQYMHESAADIEIDVYPNETLGAQAEVIQLVGEGVIDMAVVSGAQLENINEDFIAFGVPRVFDSIDHQMDVVQDPQITSELYSSLEDSNSVTVLGGFTQGARSIYSALGPVETPEDMAGAKLRVQESELNIAIAEALGASATPMSFGELYTGLQSGVVDAAENNEVPYLTQRHFEVAPYFSYTNHTIGLDYVLINTDVFEEMSEEDREIFEQGWNQAWQEHAELWKEFTAEAIEQSEAGGAEFTDSDDSAFADPLDEVADEFLVTDTQQQLYDSAREASDDD